MDEKVFYYLFYVWFINLQEVLMLCLGKLETCGSLHDFIFCTFLIFFFLQTSFFSYCKWLAHEMFLVLWLLYFPWTLNTNALP